MLTVIAISVAVGAVLALSLIPAAAAAGREGRQSTIVATDASCVGGDSPVVPGYDPVNHDVYVPNEGLAGEPSISVFNGTCNLVKTISLGSGAEPWQAAFDPEDNSVYVTDYGLNEVYVITGTKVVQTITGIDEPLGITYDPVLLGMDVVSAGTDRVYDVSGTLDLGFGVAFFTGSDPYAIAFDPSCDCDLVTNTGSDNVTLADLSPLGVFAIHVGVSPEGIAYDAASGVVYVADTGSDSLTAILPGVTGGAVDFTVTGFDQPDAVAWDQAYLHIYVTNVGNGKVYVVDGDSILKKESTASDSGASGLVYDDFIDKMYVTGYDNDEIYVLS